MINKYLLKFNGEDEDIEVNYEITERIEKVF